MAHFFVISRDPQNREPSSAGPAQTGAAGLKSTDEDADQTAAIQSVVERLRRDEAFLDAAFRNAGDGVRVVDLADVALVEVNNLLTRAVSLARRAAAGALDPGSVIRAEHQRILDEIERIRHALNGAPAIPQREESGLEATASGASVAPPDLRGRAGGLCAVAEDAVTKRSEAAPAEIPPQVDAAPKETNDAPLDQRAPAAIRPSAPSEAQRPRVTTIEDVVRQTAEEIRATPRAASLALARLKSGADQALLR